jgi:hypothetical protein
MPTTVETPVTEGTSTTAANPHSRMNAKYSSDTSRHKIIKRKNGK